MRTLVIVFIAACAATVVGLCATGIALAAEQKTTMTIVTPRTAVALEFVVERDDEGKIVKIHRFILWSDGRVTFPDLPYYANLRLNCRDCPKVPNPCPADLDGDGKVGVPDMLILQAAWGVDCPK